MPGRPGRAHTPDPAPLVAVVNTTAGTRRRPTAPLADGNATITVYLPRDWKQRVKVHCAQHGVTISDYTLALVAQDLKLR